MSSGFGLTGHMKDQPHRNEAEETDVEVPEIRDWEAAETRRVAFSNFRSPCQLCIDHLQEVLCEEVEGISKQPISFWSIVQIQPGLEGLFINIDV